MRACRGPLGGEELRLLMAATWPPRPRDGRGLDWQQGWFDAKWFHAGARTRARWPCETSIGPLDYIDGVWDWFEQFDRGARGAP